MSEYYMHQFVHTLLDYNSKYMLLYTPKPINYEDNQYKMGAIDDGYLILTENYEKLPINFENLKRELRDFYLDMAMHGFFPHDFELYLQKDGRVAMVDFDKFGEWISCDEVIIDSFNAKFEPEFLLCSPLLPREACSWIEDIKKSVRIYNRDNQIHKK